MSAQHKVLSYFGSSRFGFGGWVDFTVSGDGSCITVTNTRKEGLDFSETIAIPAAVQAYNRRRYGLLQAAHKMQLVANKLIVQPDFFHSIPTTSSTDKTVQQEVAEEKDPRKRKQMVEQRQKDLEDK